MAISRSQQPRQNYGLGSFVKKITRPFTKVAQKIVPKEIAGIARMASPFLGPVAGPLAYLAGTAKQKGRISGLDLGIASAPFLARRYDLGGKIRQNVPGGNKFMNKLFGTPATQGSYVPDAVSGGPRLETSSMIDPTNTDFRVGPEFGGTFGQIDPGTISTSNVIPGKQVFIPGSDATQGFLGSGGKMASLFGNAEKGIPSISKTGLTDLLFRKDIVDKAGIKTGKKGLDYLKLAGWTTGIYSAIEAGKYNDELEAAAAAEAAAEADGATDTEVQASIDWAKATFGRLSRADIGLAQGGRVNYAMGTEPTGLGSLAAPTDLELSPEGVVMEGKSKPLNFNFNDIVEELKEKNNKSVLFTDGTTYYPEYNTFLDSNANEVSGPSEGAEPIEENLRKSYDATKRNEIDRLFPVEAAQGGRIGYQDAGPVLPPDPTQPVNPFAPKPTGPVLPNKEMAETNSMKLLEDMAMQLFGKPLDQLDDRQREMIMSFMKPQAANGGLMRTNYALGTKPEPKESGLGGLPIEADMRYSGGFMPYGKKEKADDVPARLSKNEFVFTADAVRAAGGGSMNEGARKMYQTMKTLEQQNRMMS